MFNSDIKVIREFVVVIVKNKSIWTDIIYGEIQKMRGNV
jgi:cytolysin (calcineurin-like family phosphatase)